MSDHRRSAGLRRTWPAFFVPTAWLFYRKLWIWGAVSVIAPIVVALVVGPSNTGTAVGVEFFWLYMGKSLVCARGDKVLRGVAGMNLPPSEARAKIAAAGGVSIGGAVLGGAILAVLVAFAVVGAAHR